LDAVPGRINQVPVYGTTLGWYFLDNVQNYVWVSHAEMPIVLRVLRPQDFVALMVAADPFWPISSDFVSPFMLPEAHIDILKEKKII
jgi:hypothetical protein